MKLSNEEKAKLFVGKDNWHTYSDKEKGLESITVADGPNGCRIEKTNGFGFPPSFEAICYPTESALGCSFDRELLKKVGNVLAEDCKADGVDILLGPGVNHKRSPLCGRNFEYFSEDPVLSGELAASYINGLQESGIGSSLKHFAGNSREKGRMVEDSIIDERALHELYLRQFEIAVRKSHPWTIMNAYNRLNGIYCTEHKELMDLARNRWGFDGVFVSDWGAVSHPVNALKNGLNLEMPGGDHGTSKRILEALDEKELSEDCLNQSTERILELSAKCPRKKESFDRRYHLDIAELAAKESMVLLKNIDVLPIRKGETIALIGAFAKTPRYQGTGSSKVNCPDADCLYDVWQERGIQFEYSEGYHMADIEDPILIEHALMLAKKCNKVVVIAGLTENREAEGYDRKDMTLPINQNDLIHRLAEVNPNVAVVLQCGAPVEIPWRKETGAILLSYLSGCRGAHALSDLLLGVESPSGKLAETWPKRLKDNPSFNYYDNEVLQSQYRESIFTGYRYYETYHVEPAYPFGHGLSYTTFIYSGLLIEQTKESVKVSVDVTNSGEVRGREIVQLYMHMQNSRIARSTIELLDFDSCILNPGETRTLRFEIKNERFTYYDVVSKAYEVEEGDYEILVGASCEDIRLKTKIHLCGKMDPTSPICKDDLVQKDGTVIVSDEAFERMLGSAIPKIREPRPITVVSTVQELTCTRKGRNVNRLISHVLKSKKLRHVEGSMVFEAPIRMTFALSSRMTWDTLDVITDIFNHGFWRNVFRIRKTLKKKNEQM